MRLGARENADQGILLATPTEHFLYNPFYKFVCLHHPLQWAVLWKYIFCVLSIYNA